jgi:hypothetical protein
MEPIMSVTSAAPVTTRRPIHRITPPGTAGARWALFTALVIGAAGGAGASAALVHSQVRIVHDVRTVYVPVPSDPLPPASGNVQRKV